MMQGPTWLQQCRNAGTLHFLPLFYIASTNISKSYFFYGNNTTTQRYSCVLCNGNFLPRGHRGCAWKTPQPGTVFNKQKIFRHIAPENGQGIVYRAAAEEIKPGEADKYHCDTLVIKKGNYISLTLHDYAKNIQSIGTAFKELLSSPGLDPEGYCVEWYISGKDVQCMVRLEN